MNAMLRMKFRREGTESSGGRDFRPREPLYAESPSAAADSGLEAVNRRNRPCHAARNLLGLAAGVLALLAILACADSAEQPSPSPTPQSLLFATPPSAASTGADDQASPGIVVQLDSTPTPYPTPTAYPTATPYPTPTPFPTDPSAPTVPAATGEERGQTPEATPSPAPVLGPVIQINIPKKSEVQHPKAATTINVMIARVEAGEISVEEVAKEAPLHRGESVGVIIHLSGNVEAVAAFLRTNGGSNIIPGEDYIEAFVPVLLLGRTSEQSGVLSVRLIQPPDSPQGGSGLPGNGPAVHGSVAWNDAGYSGQGIKVGIIDTGFGGFKDLLGTKLPSAVQARCYPLGWGAHSTDLADCGDEDGVESEDENTHGTAVAESLMDLAPEVLLYISNPRSPSALKDTVNWMISENVSVINHSRLWDFDGYGDGTSPFSISPLNTIDTAVDADIVWVNAAGNHAQRTWFKRGPFSFSNVNIGGENVRVVNFSGSDYKNAFYSRGRLELRWDDTWGGATRDLDLILVHPDGERSAPYSVDIQSGGPGQNPYESASGWGGVNYGILVQHASGSEPGWIQLLSRSTSLDYSTPETGSIINPAESANPGMLAVGAASWDNLNSIEDFSSRGPTPDGRIKPDVVGADCGGIEVSPAAFCGTSQASPHVAGMAALVRQRFPNYTPAQVVSYLKDNAEQRISSPDPNNTWGHGFVVLPGITQTQQPPAGPPGAPTVTSVGSGRNSLTVRWRAPVQTGGSGITAYDLRYVRSDAANKGDAQWTVVEDVWTGVGALSHELTGLEGGRQYDLQVRAVDSTGDGPWSATDVGTPDTGEAIPQSPANAQYRHDGATVVVTWSLSTGATHHKVYYSDSRFPRCSLFASGTLNGCELLAGAVAGTTYTHSNPDAEYNSYWITACNDAGCSEIDSANPARLEGAAPAPDLVVDTPMVSESAPTAGARFTLSATVRNQGNARSGFTTLRYYRSTDSTITANDTSVGTDSVSRLEASASGDESISLTAPDTPGTYYYGACVDSVSDESDTANNCSSAVAVTVGAAPAPDLVVGAPTVSSNAPAAGASFTMDATVRNQGNGASGSTTLRYYRSTDSTITAADTSVGTDFVSSLDASESGGENVSLTAPDTPGTYYYGACVDSVSDESDTANNCSSAVAVTVGAAPAPDLVVDRPTVSTSAPAAGDRFTLSATVRNQGNGSSTLTTLGYYRSTDSTITTGDTAVGTDSVSPLNASASGDESISLTAPSTEGTYYYGACVDSVSDESDTANNCSAAVAVTVGAAPAPDLVVDTPTVSESAPTAGARFTLSATVRNQGNARSGLTTLRYYRSTDSTITANDTAVGTDSVFRLNASASGDESISLTAPSEQGTYYYGACVDPVSDESDTTNNCSSSVAVTVGAAPAPDLVVDTPTVSESAPTAGARLTLSATVRNQGNGASGSTTLRYYRSTDSVITTADTEVGTDSVPRLSASASGDESISLTAPSEQGTYYYGACVDVVSDESDTTNNCSDAVAVTVGTTPAPDLIVTNFTVSNSSPVAGQFFAMNATVNNQGNGLSSSSTLRYYRSTDATITTTDAGIPTNGSPGFLSVDGLSPSGSVDKSAGTRAPSTLGTYYFGVCVETVTGESDTTNNCSNAATVTVSRTNRPPRLTGEVDDKIVALGESFRVDLSGLFTDPDGDAITSYGFTYRTIGILSGTVNTRTGILSLRAISVGETIVAVDARDSNGTSGASEDLFNVTVTAAETAEKPGAPTGLTATADGQTEIDLSWRAPSDDGGANITGYRIEVSTNGSNWSDLVANTRSTSTSYSHTGLTAGSTRHYRVSAINSVGTGPASNTTSATTAEEVVSEGTCTVDLVVRPGERCSHPGKSAEFWVDSDGIGHYLAGGFKYRSGSKIEIRDSNINGVTYTFVASKQDDGSWLVEEVG